MPEDQCYNGKHERKLYIGFKIPYFPISTEMAKASDDNRNCNPPYLQILMETDN